MSSTLIAALFLSASQTYTLPPQLLSALCYVESTHKIEAFHMDDGGSPSLGICQIKLETARLMGFKGDQKQLMDPQVNITYSALYLHKQLLRYHQDVHKAVSAYNAGTWSMNLQGQTKNLSYVNKVLKTWEGRR